MIISKTPFRVSFFGGGTDYPLWFKDNGGAVLSASIDKYCYISCRYLPPFFAHKYRIVYSKIENVRHADDISHPAVKAILKHMACDSGLEIHHDGDLPARSGLGSSSSFTVGLVNTLSALSGKCLSKEQLAKKAIYVEQNLIEENVGSQDQISAAYGGFNKIEFYRDGDFNVEPVIIEKGRKEELENHLMLYYTGLQRNSSDIAMSVINNIPNRYDELAEIKNMVGQALEILQNKQIPIEEFGELLNQTWLTKKKLSHEVSNPVIDSIYKLARSAGAIGGKLLGAGSGGFLLLFVRPQDQPQVKRALHELIYVPVHFDNCGTKIVLYQPQGLS